MVDIVGAVSESTDAPNYWYVLKNRLKKAGNEPLASGWTRPHDWQGFFDAHRDVLAATDFLTHEILTPDGLQRVHVLMFEDITAREVWCGGIAENPDGDWMAQVARNQTDAFDGRLKGMKHLIHDNDPLFRGRLDQYVEGAGCRIKRLPPRSPELNGFMEAFIKTIKAECLNHFILTSVAQLRYVVNEYLKYYNQERPHKRAWRRDDKAVAAGRGRRGRDVHAARRIPRVVPPREEKGGVGTFAIVPRT